jgi:hypothetical protein
MERNRGGNMGSTTLGTRARFELWKLRDAVLDRARGKAHRQDVFERIHQQNLWGDADSVSGPGSGVAATEAVRRSLPALLARHGVRSVVDAPCGDFNWMRDVAPTLDRYVGVDIVPALIERNTLAYGTGGVSFLCADVTTDPLPATDLVLCRDCLIHLPTRLIHAALRNFRTSGARYLLLTNDRGADRYYDIPVGSFRRIDFTRGPFSFPAPLDTLQENAAGRELGLWELAALPLA